MAAYMRHDAHDGPRGRLTDSSNRPQRTTKSWTANGVHYTVDSSTWSSPGLNFGSFSGSADSAFSPFGANASVARGSPFGLLGSAFGLLENTLVMHPQHTVIGNDQGQGSRRRVHMDTNSEDNSIDLDHESYHGSNRRARPKSIFSRLKDRLVDNRHHSRRNESSSSERSPQQQTRIPLHRSTPFYTQGRQPIWEGIERTPDLIEVDYDDDDDDDRTDSEPEYTYHPRQDSRIPAQSDSNMIEALEIAVEIEQRNVRVCKRHLAQASGQDNISSNHLQRIIDDLKQHESTLAAAIEDLNVARSAKAKNSRLLHPARTHRRQQSHPPQPRHSPNRNVRGDFSPPPRQRQSSRDMREEFMNPHAGFPFPQHSRHPDPVFQAFQDLHGAFDPLSRTSPFSAFERFFEQNQPTADNAHFRFFTMPGTVPLSSQQKRSRTSRGPQFQQPGSRTPSDFPGPPRASVQPPQPPATVLRPEEARRLYKTYSDRWNSLPPTSPDVPFPARGLHAGGLAARDSLFAPFVNAHVGTWSEETVMQANTQAFFLGVVGLIPQYTQSPATGRIEVGFDKSQASPEQIRDLVDILKKEKIRWHSDRLGRRNGGGNGPNEALQKDERARAVFHAVCELMERAQ